MRLQLTNASQNVAFLDPATDPYTGNMVQDWMSQNPNVLSTFCNNTSFDVGHVYARYITGGAIGVAGAIGNGCLPLKAEGCSAGNGIGDYGAFFLNVIGQEVGHQLGGGHTWPGAPVNIGVTCQDFDASVEIWRFFNRYRLPLSTPVKPLPIADQVAFFPNPTADVLHLRLPDGYSRAEYVVYNNVGVVCAQGTLTGTQPTISVQSLPAGAYFLRLTAATGEVVARFLKSR
jgi:hypothetical protein